jgi:hypothetical protein
MVAVKIHGAEEVDDVEKSMALIGGLACSRLPPRHLHTSGDYILISPSTREPKRFIADAYSLFFRALLLYQTVEDLPTRANFDYRDSHGQHQPEGSLINTQVSASKASILFLFGNLPD